MTLVRRWRVFFRVLGIPLLVFGCAALPNVALASTPNPPPVLGGWVQISDADQLEYVDLNPGTYLTSDIKLLNNVDLSSDNFPWQPFGNGVTPFSGTFNGLGHQISGLSMTDAVDSFVGFFGNATGTIENVGVVGQVTAGEFTNGVGILVGDLAGGSVTNTFSAGTVSGGPFAGGLVGQVEAGSTVRGSFSTATVTGESDDTWDGGLVGSNQGNVRDSYATGSVFGPTLNGGLAGGLSGGLAGNNSGSITHSYAAGKVSNAETTGALVGDNQGVVTGSVYDATANDTTPGVGFNATDVLPDVTGLSSVQMADPSSFPGWDFTNTWISLPSFDGGYPVLRGWLSASLMADPINMTANQTVSVLGAVYYANSAIAGQSMALTVSPSEGHFANGAVTDQVYGRDGGQPIDTWVPPDVTQSTQFSITAAVYGIADITPVSVTVGPVIPAAPTTPAHSGLTDSGWMETWTPVSYASTYDVYLNGSWVGSVSTPSYRFTNMLSGTQYTVAVKAVSDVGLVGPMSNTDTLTTASATVPGPVPAPVPPPNPPLIVTKSLDGAAVIGHLYTAQLEESGGKAPFMWAVAGGSLPTGLSINDAGLISGTPTGTPGQYAFTIELSDASGLESSQSFTLLVNPAPPPPPRPQVYIPMQYGAFSGIKGPNRFGPDSFDILSLSYSIPPMVYRSGTGAIEGGSNVPAYIAFTKNVDAATPGLFAYAAEGKVFTGDIVVQKLVGGKYVQVVHLRFSGRIWDFHESVTVTAGGKPAEEIGILPLEVTVVKRQDLPGGGVSGPKTFRWDLKQNG